MNQSLALEVVVAGHICLDLFPTFEEKTALREFAPGALYKVGPALRSTGGAVANTGLALHRLGLQVGLCGKVGEDLFGHEILRLLGEHGPSLTAGMKLSRGEASSFIVVISPPGIDRTFLHCGGCNDRFTANDLNRTVLAQARLMHFGYPPLMRSMYADGGAELQRVMKTAKDLGLTTSLDLALPDPDSEAGQMNWRAILAQVLPQSASASGYLHPEPGRTTFHAGPTGLGIVDAKRPNRFGKRYRLAPTWDDFADTDRDGNGGGDDQTGRSGSLPSGHGPSLPAGTDGTGSSCNRLVAGCTSSSPLLSGENGGNHRFRGLHHRRFSHGDTGEDETTGSSGFRHGGRCVQRGTIRRDQRRADHGNRP